MNELKPINFYEKLKSRINSLQNYAAPFDVFKANNDGYSLNSLNKGLLNGGPPVKIENKISVIGTCNNNYIGENLHGNKISITNLTYEESFNVTKIFIHEYPFIALRMLLFNGNDKTFTDYVRINDIKAYIKYAKGIDYSPLNYKNIYKNLSVKLVSCTMQHLSSIKNEYAQSDNLFINQSHYNSSMLSDSRIMITRLEAINLLEYINNQQSRTLQTYFDSMAQPFLPEFSMMLDARNDPSLNCQFPIKRLKTNEIFHPEEINLENHHSLTSTKISQSKSFGVTVANTDMKLCLLSKENVFESEIGSKDKHPSNSSVLCYRRPRDGKIFVSLANIHCCVLPGIPVETIKDSCDLFKYKLAKIKNVTEASILYVPTCNFNRPGPPILDDLEAKKLVYDEDMMKKFSSFNGGGDMKNYSNQKSSSTEYDYLYITIGQARKLTRRFVFGKKRRKRQEVVGVSKLGKNDLTAVTVSADGENGLNCGESDPKLLIPFTPPSLLRTNQGSISLITHQTKSSWGTRADEIIELVVSNNNNNNNLSLKNVGTVFRDLKINSRPESLTSLQKICPPPSPSDSPCLFQEGSQERRNSSFTDLTTATNGNGKYCANSKRSVKRKGRRRKHNLLILCKLRRRLKRYYNNFVVKCCCSFNSCNSGTGHFYSSTNVRRIHRRRHLKFSAATTFRQNLVPLQITFLSIAADSSSSSSSLKKIENLDEEEIVEEEHMIVPDLNEKESVAAPVYGGELTNCSLYLPPCHVDLDDWQARTPIPVYAFAYFNHHPLHTTDVPEDKFLISLKGLYYKLIDNNFANYCNTQCTSCKVFLPLRSFFETHVFKHFPRQIEPDQCCNIISWLSPMPYSTAYTSTTITQPQIIGRDKINPVNPLNSTSLSSVYNENHVKTWTRLITANFEVKNTFSTTVQEQPLRKHSQPDSLVAKRTLLVPYRESSIRLNGEIKKFTGGSAALRNNNSRYPTTRSCGPYKKSVSINDTSLQRRFKQRSILTFPTSLPRWHLNDIREIFFIQQIDHRPFKFNYDAFTARYRNFMKKRQNFKTPKSLVRRYGLIMNSTKIKKNCPMGGKHYDNFKNNDNNLRFGRIIPKYLPHEIESYVKRNVLDLALLFS